MNRPTPDAKSIFGRAAEIPAPADRAAFLDDACAGHPAVRAEVETLLKALGNAGAFMAAPAAPAGETVSYDTPISEGEGTVIGLYTLREQIGEGGMGLVFVAEQTQPVRRKVALKVIKPGMDTRQVVARFEAERQALALMDHPNIAKVFDAGATDAGRPYFVMELVKGVPITEYADANNLTPKDRLALFVQVCQAVQHAHQKGVIHRDLKPSNILVAPHDGIPVVKVIDFGVAKALGQSLTDKTIYTRFAQMIGTPLYMSPEQAEVNQLDADTRSDVYSLGVLLYELLTGTTPFDGERFRKAAFDEIRRIIKEEEPPRPSTRLTSLGATLTAVSAKRGTDPGRLAGLVRGELDWIVMRCLEKDRTRRYDSAAGLAKDVQRYLTGDSVEACPPTRGYRLKKAYRRNRAAVLVGGAFAAVLLAATGVSITFGLQATRAGKVAESARVEADDQRDLAVKAGIEAAVDRDKTKVALENLSREGAERRAEQYAMTLTTLPVAWESGSVVEAQRLLDRLRPAPGEHDLRNFEWRYWDRQLHAELSTTQLPVPPVSEDRPGRVSSIGQTTTRDWVISADGSRAAVLRHTTAAANPAAAVMLVQVWDIASRKRLLSHEIPDDARTEPGLVATCALRFSRDGGRLAVVANAWVEKPNPGTGSWVRYRRLALDVDSSKVLVERTSDDVPGSVTHIDVSADGRFCLLTQPATDTKLSTEVCDLDAGGKQVATLAHSQIVGFTPDGSRVFERSGNAKVWASATGREFQGLDAGQGLRYWIFSPDGSRIFGIVSPRGAGAKAQAAGVPQVVKVLDAASGKGLPDIPLPEGSPGTAGLTYSALRPNATPMSPDGSRLWLQRRKSPSSTDVEVIVIDAKQGRRLFSLDSPSIDAIGGGHAGAARFSPDGKLFCLPNHTDRSIAVHDATTGRLLRTLRGHTRPIEWFAVTPDSRRLRSVEADGTLKEWNLLPEPPAQVDCGDRMMTSGDSGLELSGDGRWAAASFGGQIREADVVRVWHAAGTVSKEFTVRPRPSTPSPTAGYYLGFPVLNHDGTRVALLRGSHDPSSPAAKENAVNTPSGDITVWDVASGKELFYAAGYFHGSYCAITPDGDVVAALRWLQNGGNEIVPIDVKTGREHRPIPLPPGAHLRGDLKYRADGKRLAGILYSRSKRVSASQGQEGALTVWDVTDGKQLDLKVGLLSASLPNVTWSPDGRSLLTTASRIGRPVTIHNAETGEVESTLDTASRGGRIAFAARPAFTPDGLRVACAVNTPKGRIIKVWDARSGRELLDLPSASNQDRGLSNLPHLVAFTSDGHRLLEYVVKPRNRPGTVFRTSNVIDVTTWDATPRPELKQP